MSSEHSKSRICVIGLGYIGLPTAALLASRDYKVHGVDVLQEVVNTINRGEIHITEPALDAFVKQGVESGNLKCDTKPEKSDVFIIAVPTPFKENHVPDISYIEAATKSIAPYLQDGNIVILESTSPVGTTEKVRDMLDSEGVDTSKIYIAHCPERVLPGKIMKELIENDRIVGGVDDKSTQRAANFYREFVEGKIVETDARTAEMAKLTENSFRDVNIAFANELSLLCENLNIDARELINLANLHPRVNILSPGVGVGGHCIAVDPWFIVSQNRDTAKIIRTAREVNTHKTEWVIEKIIEAINEFKKSHNKNPVVACMGLAYKPDIDDLRESPALYIAEELDRKGYNVLCSEPNISNHSFLKLEEPNSLVKKADIVIYLVAHKEFTELTPKDENKPIFDFCGVLD